MIFIVVVVIISLKVSLHHDHGNSYKEKYFIEAGLHSRGLVLYCHGGKHSGVQVGMVLVK